MSHLNEVQRQLILKLRDDLTDFNENVVITTSVDFSTDGIVIEDALLPILYLVGPKMDRNGLFTTNVNPSERYGDLLEDEETPSQFRKFTAEDSVDLEYQAIIVDNHESRFTDLNTKTYAYFMNGKKVTAEKNPGTPADGSNSYEVDLIEKFTSTVLVNRSNLKQSSGRILVRGVQVSDGQIFSEGFVADTIQQDIQEN